MWTIDLPLHIPCNDQSKPVKHRAGYKPPLFPLNLNQYRNAHFQVLNHAKVNFEILARKLIGKHRVPKLSQVALEYVLYPGTTQICDVNNICSIVDKFFSDSLVKCAVLEDDNYKFITDSRFRFGHIDRENPRVTVIIRSPDHIPLVPPEPVKKEDLMKIKTVVSTTVELDQNDLLKAIREYLQKNAGVTVASDQEIALNVKEGGGWEVSITQTTQEAPKPRGRPRLEPAEAIRQAKDAAGAPRAPEGAPGPSSVTPANDESGSTKILAKDVPSCGIVQLLDGRWLQFIALTNGGKVAFWVVKDGQLQTDVLQLDSTVTVFDREKVPDEIIDAFAGGVKPAEGEASSPAPESTEQPKTEETTTPPPPAKPSLFSGFTRPKNP